MSQQTPGWLSVSEEKHSRIDEMILMQQSADIEEEMDLDEARQIIREQDEQLYIEQQQFLREGATPHFMGHDPSRLQVARAFTERVAALEQDEFHWTRPILDPDCDPTGINFWMARAFRAEKDLEVEVRIRKAAEKSEHDMRIAG